MNPRDGIARYREVFTIHTLDIFERGDEVSPEWLIAVNPPIYGRLIAKAEAHTGEKVHMIRIIPYMVDGAERTQLIFHTENK